MCKKTCGKCVPYSNRPASASAPTKQSITPIMIEPVEATTQPMTTVDEHGFNPSQMREIQRPNSHASFPCEKDQARYNIVHCYLTVV